MRWWWVFGDIFLLSSVEGKSEEEEIVLEELSYLQSGMRVVQVSSLGENADTLTALRSNCKKRML